MSFNPPQFPTADQTYQYGNLIWRFDGTAGVWNIVDGSLVGEQGPQGPAGPQGPQGNTGNTGSPSTGDSASIIVSNGFITARLGAVGITGVLGVSNRFSVVNGIAHPLPASNGASGIASFDSTYFSVSGTGHVSINSGVTSFNGLTGAVTLTGDGGAVLGAGNNRITVRLVTQGTTGIASFNTTHFSVSSSTGHVSLAEAYQATGDTVITVPGSGIAISTSGRTDTLFNIGVTSFNGLTGTITLTGDGGAIVGRNNTVIGARLADGSLTGVARFPSPFFTVADGAVSLASPYSVIGVTGIGVGTNDPGITGRVTLTASGSVTLVRAGNTITIGGGGGGGAAGITASPQQVLFSSGNGGTGSDNFVFNGLAATFGGANTQFTITGPTFTIGNNTVVRGGIFFDAAEAAPYTDFANSAVSIKASNGSVQRVRVNRTDTGSYSVEFDESAAGNWTSVTGVAESVVVILQSANGKTGGFASGILLPSASTILGGVTGGIDVFTMMRIPYVGGSLKMAFPIARGMTGTDYSIGTS